MSEAGKLQRGGKWYNILEKAKFEENKEVAASMKSQASIVEDIKFYMEHAKIKPEPSQPKDPKKEEKKGV